MPGSPTAVRSFHNFGRPRSLSASNKDAKLLIRKFRDPKSHSKPLNQAGTNNSILGAFTKKKSPKGASQRKSPQRNDRSGADVTAVPNPVPDAGVHPSNGQPQGFAAHRPSSSQSNTAGDPISTTALVVQPFSFSPLPPLASAVSTFTPSSSLSVSASSTQSVLPAENSEINQTQHQQSHHVSTAVITLLAVGSAFVLLGVFIVIRSYRRPRKRQHPTPSLPILDKEFKDEEFAADGSPIFGGKERYSARPCSEGMWAFYQYQPGIAKPAAAAGHGRTTGDEWGGYGVKKAAHEEMHCDGYKQKTQHSDGAPTEKLLNQAPIVQQTQAALTRVASRLSATSASLYPNSPLDADDIGIAVDGVTSLTADGHPVIKRAKSIGSVRGHNRVSRGNDEQNTVYSQYSQAFAYCGTDVTSPMPRTSQSVPAITVATPAVSGGRSRIKSTYYTPGAYARTSAGIPASKSVRHPFQESQYHVAKSESRRDGQTNTLTFALGLDAPNTPQPPSPQPTLFPEDSLSDSGEARRPPALKRTNKKPATKAAAANRALVSPTTETSASLGNLMLMDFGGTTASLAYLKDPSNSSSSLTPKKSARSDDNPPRVPSPPPMPSLSQMGLAHANPEAFADYRSPTYSIYNLYGPGNDRKSRVSLGPVSHD